MGAALGIVEIVALGFMAEEAVRMEVIKKKIRDLVQRHKEEFETINTCFKFLERLNEKQNLIYVLSGAQTSASKNWTLIDENVRLSINILKGLKEQFGRTEAKFTDQKYQFNLKQFGIKMGLMGLGQGFYIYNLVKFFQANNLDESIVIRRRQFPMEEVNRQDMDLLQNEGEINLAQNNFQGQRAAAGRAQNDQANIQINEDLQLQNIFAEDLLSVQSFDPEPGNWERFKRYGAFGLRLVFVAYMIYQDYELLEENKRLVKELEELGEYFKKSGKFQEHEKQMIKGLKYSISLIFTLMSAGRAMVFQYRKIYMTSSLIIPKSAKQYSQKVKKFNPNLLGFDQKFYSDVRNQLNKALKIQDSNPKQGMQQMAQIALVLKDDLKVMEKFSDLTEFFMQNLNLGNLELNEFIKNEKSILTFIKSVSAQMKRRKNLPVEQLLVQDPQIVNILFYVYMANIFPIYHEDDEPQPQTPQDLFKVDKLRFFNFIISYTDKFYADDKTGETFFGYSIKDYSAHFPYDEIEKNVDGDINIIPVELEGPEKDEFFNLFLAKGMEMKPEWKNQEKYKLTPIMRFIRLDVLKNNIEIRYEDEIGHEVIKKEDQLVFYDGLKIHVRDKSQGENAKSESWSVERDEKDAFTVKKVQ